MAEFRSCGLLLCFLAFSGSSWGCTGHTSQGDLPPRGFIDVDGALLHYRIVGQGPPLVILHGGPGLSYGYLYPQLEPLLADDFTLIFYDQRASGRSTGRVDTTRLSMATFISDLEQVRQALNLEQMNLLGHSFGGLLAMHYAIQHPSRVGRLILLDTDAASWQLRTPYQRQVVEARTTADDRREMAAVEAREGWENNPEAMGRYFRIGLRTYFADRKLTDHLALEFDSESLANYRLTSRLVRQDLGRYDIHDSLHRITSPTLLIHGDSSIFSVEGARAIHERIPRSKLVVLPNVGHFAYIEAPDTFEATIREFMKETAVSIYGCGRRSALPVCVGRPARGRY